MSDYRDVLAAARGYLAEHGEVVLPDAYLALAGRFAVKTNPYGVTERQVWDTFRGQVQRAFGRLATEGACRKVAANVGGPDGTWDRSPRYYTDAAWEAAHKRGEARDAAARDEANRYEAIHGRLAALGILTLDASWSHARREAPRLAGPHQWERLLDMAAPPPPPADPHPHAPEWM